MTEVLQGMQHAQRLVELGQWAEAEAACRAVLRSEPAHCEALTLLGIITIRTGRADEAADCFARAVAARPDEAGAHLNYGSVLRALRRFEEALDSCNRALEIDPHLADAYNNRGNALNDLGRFAEALQSYDSALQLNPNYSEAYNNRAGTLQKLGRFEEALDSCERALAIRPEFADAHYNRGNALGDAMRFSEALDCYDRALQLNPQHAEAHLNRGTMLQELLRPNEALDSFARALQLNPDLAEAYASRGHTLRTLGRVHEAFEDYTRARALDPSLPGLYGVWLHTKAQLCDWEELDTRVAEFVAGIESTGDSTAPFFAVTLVDSPALQLRTARTWVNDHCRPHLMLPATARRRPARLRIGYYSADFRNHALAHLLAGLIEAHDRERFFIVAFSFGGVPDEMRARLSAGFDEFVDVSGLSDQHVAQLSRDRNIDIAVDLMGFTHQQRMPIFSYRAAPIQVAYLGYPGTTGAPFMDYLVADSVLIPESSREHYSEKIIYLPYSYQVNDNKRRIADRRPSRSELGLPPKSFVFCCFNNPYKIVPAVFDSWMRILNQVTGSVLWLLKDDDRSAANLRKEAQARGVNGARLLFAARTSLPEHLARHSAADLFLDTLPFNAHTTASDALWAALPVLTRTGECFAARVAASLIHAIGMPELVTDSAAQYEASAIDLATHPDRLTALRIKLNAHRLTRPLFDTALFTRHLEAAYSRIYERYEAGLNPEHAWVPP